MIEDINRQLPTLPARQKLDESAIIKKQEELKHLYNRYPESILSYLTEMSFLHYDKDFVKTLPPKSFQMYEKIDAIMNSVFEPGPDDVRISNLDGYYDLSSEAAKTLAQQYLEVEAQSDSAKNAPKGRTKLERIELKTKLQELITRRQTLYNELGHYNSVVK